MLTILWLVVSVVFLQSRPLSAARPNVLLLFSDDQRYDTLAALGNPNIRTPNLDRLTREGLAFTRAYIMGGTQGAVCVPSRAMLMTGRTLFRIKENLQGQTTWPEKFAEAGYTTFITGKWHNGAPALLHVFNQGQAVFLGGMGNPWALRVADISPDHKLVNQRTNREHSIQQFADAAIEFLARQKGGPPFLCYVAFNAPHDPRTAPTNYHEYYNAHLPPLPPNFLPQHPFNNGDLTLRDELLAPWPRTPEIVRQHLADYYAYVEFLDAQIGRILAALRANGQAENTIVVFASDNGLAIGSHGLFGKQNVYEHSTHEPLIFAGPGIPQGKRSDAFCYVLDIFPTLGDFCGVPAPEGSEGQSLRPVIRGETDRSRDSIFTAYRHLQRAVRDERWKLIQYTQVNYTQLFDLRNDPHETRNLAAEAQHADEVARLTARLKEWQQQLGDTQPLTTNQPAPLEFDFRNASKQPKKKAGKQTIP